MTYNYMSDEKDNKITTETIISSSDKDFVKKLRNFSKSCQSMHVKNFNNIKQIISKEEIERFNNDVNSIKKSISLNKNLLENFSNTPKSFDTLKPEFGKSIEFTKLDTTMFIDHKLVALRKISEKLDKLPDTEKIKEAVLENEEKKPENIEQKIISNQNINTQEQIEVKKEIKQTINKEPLHKEIAKKGGIERHKTTNIIKNEIIKKMFEKINGLSVNQKAINLNNKINEAISKNEFEKLTKQYDISIQLTKEIKEYLKEDHFEQIYKWCLSLNKNTK